MIPLLVRMLAIAAVIGWAVGPAHAAGTPMVRVKIDATGPVLVGQQVRVDVQVLVPNFFLSAPDFPTFDIPGAIVTMPDESALNLTETIGAESYAGIQKTYVIVAQQAGEFTLPPARITFQYAAVPGQPPADGVVALPPQTFTATLPAGAPASAGTVPVAKVTITQSLDGEATGLKAGDALIRTVEVFAERTQAMMIPPPAFDAPAGVRVYVQDPVLTDVTRDRIGFLGGRRIDRATYVFEKPGDYTLPGVEIPWFNAATSKQEIARAPEVTVSVAPNPGFQPAIAPGAPPDPAPSSPAKARFDWTRMRPWIAAAIAAALLLGWSCRRYAPRWRAWREARRHAREESEPAYFARVEHACRANDAPGTYRALAAWARRTGAGSITACVEELGSPSLRDEITALEQALFARRGADGAWSGRGLASAATEARAVGRARRARAVNTSPALPALNP